MFGSYINNMKIKESEAELHEGAAQDKLSITFIR